MDLIRDAPVGQLIRLITRNRVLKYPEEESTFQCPTCYKDGDENPADSMSTVAESVNDETPNDEIKVEKTNTDENPTPEEDNDDISAIYEPIASGRKESVASTSGPLTEKVTTRGTIGTIATAVMTRRPSLARVDTTTAFHKSTTRADLEEQYTNAMNAEKESLENIEPGRLECGTILVDWYSTKDPANPQNWSTRRKCFVSSVIYFYTFTFYLGSAIYAPSAEGIMEYFHVGPQVASLGLSMYVLAYGIGPLIFSPLSEIPSIGRNPPYIITFSIFLILLGPTPGSESIAQLMALRFFAGFFGSPCLATGGASLGDMFSLIKLPYAVSLWAFCATCGPALGPLLSGYSVMAESWRWSMWELLWLAGPAWIGLFVFLPETSSANILLRRAQRLRKSSGNPMIKSQSEIDQASLSIKEIAVDAFWRPIQTILLDPSIAFTAVYTALIYGIYYSFFEAFPIVYLGYFGFSLGGMGLAFLSIIVGAILGTVAYWAYLYKVMEPDIRTNGLGAPERRLVPALFASFLLPVGLFIFAWTSSPNLHWIGPTVGIAVFTIGIYIVIQCVFLYLPLTYPQYQASLFAGNDFLRSTLAAGTIHFASPLYANLGVGPGVSLLAGLTCGCIFGIFGLWHYGEWLRKKSRFAAK